MAGKGPDAAQHPIAGSGRAGRLTASARLPCAPLLAGSADAAGRDGRHTAAGPAGGDCAAAVGPGSRQQGGAWAAAAGLCWQPGDGCGWAVVPTGPQTAVDASGWRATLTESLRPSCFVARSQSSQERFYASLFPGRPLTRLPAGLCPGRPASLSGTTYGRCWACWRPRVGAPREQAAGCRWPQLCSAMSLRGRNCAGLLHWLAFA